ncbi:unnamed protein product [Ophioblennius macclurei]
MAYPGFRPSAAFSPPAFAAPSPVFAAPPTSDPSWAYFKSVAGLDGEVDAQELQTCLTQSGFSGSYNPFSLETCRLMIAMLDKDYSGKMGFSEFQELFAALNGWKKNFTTFDQDHNGTIERHEMTQAMTSMGYHVSPQVIDVIVKRYSREGRIYFDDYVACCIKLQALTADFKRRDIRHQAKVTYNYDDFLLCTMAI